MKAVISSTYSDTYLYFLPIVSFCWNRLGVDVICFMPYLTSDYDNNKKVDLILETVRNDGLKIKVHQFNAPEHKQATYAQCSRLYAACLDLPEDEVLITSDVDMAVFTLPPYQGGFTIFGSDLVPPEQIPMCYISAKVKDWRRAFSLQYGSLSNAPNAVVVLNTKTYQQCLDGLVGAIECEHFRGNQWSLDQGEAYRKIWLTQEINVVYRARPNTQFATHRVDRDDSFWRDRISNKLVDAHLWRPGYEPQNFANILELMQTMYPYEDFIWLVDYTEQYNKLL